ncbi:hypothetical protein J2Z37_003786 [Ammoniphilus resinae]|uniref:DUF1385 domain-containing protein n=2 Tax=Ammoniphilus resinae TaxID=861532 RepID=A0ABS4GU39_9BACL|nr:hypothetical protein [Ammoniphilus resinae]
MDKEYIAHSGVDTKGNIVTHLFTYDKKGMLFFAKRIIVTVPWYLIVGILGLIIWIIRQPDYPFYLLPLATFGYHFFFPYPLRQFHGAEHKMFSHQGEKSLETLHDIAESDIVNYHCSTNSVVTFYLLFFLGLGPFGGNLAAILGLIGVVVIPRWLKGLQRHVIFPISKIIQRQITTVEPDLKHLKTALFSYLTLTRRQVVSEKLLRDEMKKAKEEQELAIQKEQEQKQLLLREQIIQETEWVEI